MQKSCPGTGHGCMPVNSEHRGRFTEPLRLNGISYGQSKKCGSRPYPPSESPQAPMASSKGQQPEEIFPHPLFRKAGGRVQELSLSLMPQLVNRKTATWFQPPLTAGALHFLGLPPLHLFLPLLPQQSMLLFRVIIMISPGPLRENPGGR